jgi:hypothetical protein
MNEVPSTQRPVPGHGSGQLDELLAESFPRMLMLQTVSACNSACVFCPHRRFRTSLPQGEMDDELFRRLLAEASEHPEVSCINLFLMNEPLLDPRLVERVYMAKRACPQAQISLWTNGVALDPELAGRLLDAPLDSLGISLHAHHAETYRRLTGRRDFPRVLGNVVNVVEQRLVRRPDLTLVIRYVSADRLQRGEEQELAAFWQNGGVVLDIDEGYLSRAGNLEAPGGVGEPQRWMAGCQALGGPKQAHVLFTGQVVMCCMDYARQSSLGDCTQESLGEIWRGPRRREALEMLYGAREAPGSFLCSRCELAIPRRCAAETCTELNVPKDAIWAAV